MSQAEIIKQEKTKYVVAVWWCREGDYGGSSSYPTMPKALEHCEQLRKLGYDKPGKSEIHIQRQRCAIMKFNHTAKETV